MALRFKRAAAVAVGSFNIYVIQPKWLTEVNLLPAGKRVEMATDLNRPGLRYSIEGVSMKWDVRPDRLMIQSESAADDCGAVLADVLEKLPWTPLAGVGTNFEFVGDPVEIASVPTNCAPPSCDTPDGYLVKQASSHVALQRESQIYNFQLSRTEKVELYVNIHTELTNKGTQEVVNRMAQDACRQFTDFRYQAASLARQLLSIEVVYE